MAALCDAARMSPKSLLSTTSTTTTRRMSPSRTQGVKRTRGRACDAPRATYSTQSAIENATVCVTGANRGIGLELCKMFLSKGNVVHAACRRSSDDLEALRATSGGRLKISQLDVSDEGSIERWARELKASGTTHLDVVVNNAGVVGTDGYTKWDLDDMTQEEMLYVFKVNTVGPVLVVKYLVREGLLGGDSDSLVGNVTSKVGSVDDNGSGRGYAYRASKSALNNCNKSMSIDLAEQNVHFALLHPGWVRTDMTEGRGLIDAEESAAGLISVLEGKFGDCETTWFDYKGDAIPW